MAQGRRMVNMRRAVAAVISVAIVFAMLISPINVCAMEPDYDAYAMQQYLLPCCEVPVDAGCLPCCEIDAEVGGCCFIVYLPPTEIMQLALTASSNVDCVEPFHYRDICDFIFEPPKV